MASRRPRASGTSSDALDDADRQTSKASKHGTPSKRAQSPLRRVVQSRESPAARRSGGGERLDDASGRADAPEDVGALDERQARSLLGS